MSSQEESRKRKAREDEGTSHDVSVEPGESVVKRRRVRSEVVESDSESSSEDIELRIQELERQDEEFEQQDREEKQQFWRGLERLERGLERLERGLERLERLERLAVRNCSGGPQSDVPLTDPE